MNKATIKDIDVTNKRVLVRVDFNVPLDPMGNITDDRRIKAALPTIQYLIDHQAKVVLMSHLGRPDGKVVESMRLDPAAQKLSQLVNKKVQKLNDCIGCEIEAAAEAMKPGDVVLLENVRFHAEEEKNDPQFAKELAKLGEIYVNDAFGTAHRAHASTEGVAHYLPAVAGFLMIKELEFLGQALENPQRPFVAIVGGAKISDKITVLERLISIADTVLIGGGMANTFFKSQGYDVRESLVEDSKLEEARSIMEKAASLGKSLILPRDVVIADKFTADAVHEIVSPDDVPDKWRILDIGPQTINDFGTALLDAKTILWNGTMGVAEMPAFARGTNALIQLLAECTSRGAITIVGGGDSAAAVETANAADQMTHVSTGGGASLEFLEGRELPGVAALADKQLLKAGSNF